MFTGIIETLAKVEDIRYEGNNVHFTFSCAITHELKIDQSVAHNGVCLTVVSINQDQYTVTAIDETLKRSNLGHLKKGNLVNLERCMPASGRFDGHIVQGHVDTTSICTQLIDHGGSTEFVFRYKEDPHHITVEKGSITVNGVSLTVVQSGKDYFSVFIIPYTMQHTNFREIQENTTVNLEFDIIGKYISRILGR